MCSTLSRTGRKGTDVCYASRKSSLSAPPNVPLFPYYAHADNSSRLAISVTTLSSPSLIDKPARGLHGQRVLFIYSQKGAQRTHIFLYILKASILSSNTFNDIRRKPNSRKPYVISQCMSSVPKPRPRYLSFNAIATAASRSGGGLKLRLMCPKNSCPSESLSSTTRKKIVPLAIDSIVFCKNCSVRVGERSSMKENRWTRGSHHRFKNSLSSVEA